MKTAASEGRLRVVIGDQSRLFRDAMQVAIERTGNMIVVGSAGNGRELMDHARSVRPQVALLDSELPEEGGLPACASMKQLLPHCSILVIDRTPDTGHVIAALEAGADGYVAKTSKMADMLHAVERSLAGETYVPPGMLGGLLRRLIQQRREETKLLERFSLLSRREKEILALLVDGLDDQAMAEKLYISRHTVRTHIQNSLGKLGVHARDQAVALAIQYDLHDRYQAADGD